MRCKSNIFDYNNKIAKKKYFKIAKKKDFFSNVKTQTQSGAATWRDNKYYVIIIRRGGSHDSNAEFETDLIYLISTHDKNS